MSSPLFASLGAWNWLILGIALMVLELLAPGIFLFWLGLAALVTGLLAFAIDASWQIQILAFALLTIAAVPLWRRFSVRSTNENSPFLNRRNEALIGREMTLERPIQAGIGTLNIDDTVWRVSGPDTPAGSRVRIVAADGASITVAPVDPMMRG